MNIPLKPDLQRFIDDEVRNGRYESPEVAINAAVAHLQAEHDLAGLSIEALRHQIHRGVVEADRGEFVAFTAESVIAERRSRQLPAPSSSS